MSAEVIPFGSHWPDGCQTWTRSQWWAWHDAAPGNEQTARYNTLTQWARANHVEDDMTTTSASDHVSDVRAASSWDPADLDGLLDSIKAGTLELPAATVGEIEGGGGLFYPERVNGVAGDSGSGKGWILLAVALQEMQAGRSAWYVDYEDSAALALLRLVKVLGAPIELVRERFRYLHPEGHDKAAIRQAVERVKAEPGSLVIIDSTGESIAASGRSQNIDEDVASWMQELAHPLAAEAGACVVLVDHVVKGDDNGLWPIGSQRKRAAITGAQYVVEVRHSFSATVDGLVDIKVAKDRNGEREAGSVASRIRFTHEIESTSTRPDGSLDVVLSSVLTVTFEPGKTAEQVRAEREAAKARKAQTALDADVAELDRMQPPPKSQRDVVARNGWGGTRALNALREWRERSATAATP